MTFEGKWKVTFGEKDALLRGCSSIADIAFSREEQTFKGKEHVPYRILLNGAKNDKGDMIGIECLSMHLKTIPEVQVYGFYPEEVISTTDMMIQTKHVIARFSIDEKKLNIYYFSTNEKLFTFEKV